MSSLDREILSCIRRIRIRIHRNRVFNHILWGIIIALCLGSIVCITALLIPIYKVYMIATCIVVAGATLALVFGLIRVPANDKVARIVDNLGLNERAVTAMELIGKESSFAVLQKKDTLKSLQKLDYKDKLPANVSKRQISLLLIFTLVIAGTLFISTPAKAKAQEKQKFETIRKEKLAQAEKTERSLKDNSKLSEEDKNDLLSHLSSLKEELARTESMLEIDKALERFQVKTNMIKEKYKDEDLKGLTAGLHDNETTAKLAEAIAQGNKEETASQIEKLPEIFEKASEDEKKRLAADFAEMAKNSEDEELKASLKEIAEKLAASEQNKPVELGNSLDNFKESVNENMENREAKTQLKDIQDNFQPDKDNLRNHETSEAGNGPEGNKPGVNPGDEPSNTTGDKNEPGEGGKTDNTGQNPDTTPSPGGNNVPSEGISKPGGNTMPSGENVFVPSTGSTSSTGSGDVGGNQGPGDGGTTSRSGTTEALDKVIGKYKERAYENMNSYIIPDAMKDIIKSYFTSLGE